MGDLADDSAAPAPRSADFAIRLEFERNSGDPSRIFKAMAGLIEACQVIDSDLAAAISIRVQPVLVLQDIRAESLTAWLKYLLKSVDDDAIQSLDWRRMVGSYLVKGKRKLVGFLEGRSTIKSASELYELRDMLGDAAGEAGLTLISLNSPVPAPRIAEGLQRLSGATTPLIRGDEAQYVTEEGTMPINASFRVTTEAI